MQTATATELLRQLSDQGDSPIDLCRPPPAVEPQSVVTRPCWNQRAAWHDPRHHSGERSPPAHVGRYLRHAPPFRAPREGRLAPCEATRNVTQRPHSDHIKKKHLIASKGTRTRHTQVTRSVAIYQPGYDITCLVTACQFKPYEPSATQNEMRIPPQLKARTRILYANPKHCTSEAGLCRNYAEDRQAAAGMRP